MSSEMLPIPPHFEPESVGKVWKVPYQQRAEEAKRWAEQHHLQAASGDELKICLLLIDVQNTFCIPDFELFVGGRSGTGAVEDNRRLCEFIYRNSNVITQICPTMDTHQAIQIFHSIFFIDKNGAHPEPYTLISSDEVNQGMWTINPRILDTLGVDRSYSSDYLQHYTESLSKDGKYNLTVWPYHAMLGGIGHALAAAVEEAIFFHSIARLSPTDFTLGRLNPLTENYSVVKPEVMEDHRGTIISDKDPKIIDKLTQFDALIVAGQAKSHCVAWTIEDLYLELINSDSSLVKKIYLIEDCTSPVVVPGVIDYTDQADQTYRRFADLGMHIIDSSQDLSKLPGLNP